MRDLRLLDAHRVQINGLSAGDDREGAFQIPSPIDRGTLRIIASADLGWDHVSVSRQNRPPNWTEMSFVKRLFFKEGETAMQLHVPVEDHVNCHPNCLHLWRPHDQEIPRPPSIMVGAPNGTVGDGVADDTAAVLAALDAAGALVQRKARG